MVFVVREYTKRIWTFLLNWTFIYKLFQKFQNLSWFVYNKYCYYIFIMLDYIKYDTLSLLSIRLNIINYLFNIGNISIILRKKTCLYHCKATSLFTDVCDIVWSIINKLCNNLVSNSFTIITLSIQTCKLCYIWV